MHVLRPMAVPDTIDIQNFKSVFEPVFTDVYKAQEVQHQVDKISPNIEPSIFRILTDH